MPLTKVSYSMITGAPVNILDYGFATSASAAANKTAFLAAVAAAGRADSFWLPPTPSANRLSFKGPRRRPAVPSRGRWCRGRRSRRVFSRRERPLPGRQTPPRSGSSEWRVRQTSLRRGKPSRGSKSESQNRPDSSGRISIVPFVPVTERNRRGPPKGSAWLQRIVAVARG